jgi:hypothetical protein
LNRRRNGCPWNGLRVVDYFSVSKLEGRTHTLKKRKYPASVAIYNQAEILSGIQTRHGGPTSFALGGPVGGVANGNIRASAL